MHEFDEICFNKTKEELETELKFQLQLSNNKTTSLIMYIKDCIKILSDRGQDVVNWTY